MFLKKEWLGGLVLLFTLGCEQSSDTVINIPNLQLECSLSDSGLCSSGNPQTVTGFVRLSRSGCGDSDHSLRQRGSGLPGFPRPGEALPLAF